MWRLLASLVVGALLAAPASAGEAPDAQGTSNAPTFLQGVGLLGGPGEAGCGSPGRDASGFFSDEAGVDLTAGPWAGAQIRAALRGTMGLEGLDLLFDNEYRLVRGTGLAPEISLGFTGSLAPFWADGGMAAPPGSPLAGFMQSLGEVRVQTGWGEREKGGFYAGIELRTGQPLGTLGAGMAASGIGAAGAYGGRNVNVGLTVGGRGLSAGFTLPGRDRRGGAFSIGVGRRL